MKETLKQKYGPLDGYFWYLGDLPEGTLYWCDEDIYCVIGYEGERGDIHGPTRVEWVWGPTKEQKGKTLILNNSEVRRVLNATERHEIFG